ncbi:hypothetical protein AMATHDRAFT_42456 [Amanita thiersii Skay4041]|uniref:Crinkler effector protein N-terminal domain-containing protein n=1 Tax=Amanita thiersii Skay4041 TaxID=703135 RepID=A0A2A9NK91_9AGAR|nr:hypothetical protein AMATHDRAFT_42456 [Amanita thiersii Skay4041]
MSDKLRLVCHIEGDPGTRLFEVHIPTTRSVAFLKECIKSKLHNTFEHVDACELVIWKLIGKAPISNVLDGKFDPSANRQELRNPIATLSGIFPEQLDVVDVHLLIKPPPPMQVDWFQDIHALKKEIISASSELHNVVAKELILWKTLDSTIALKNMFPDVPRQDHVHIVIKCPSASQCRFRNQRCSSLAQLRARLPAPCVSVQSSSLASIQRGILTEGTIACHLPQTMQVTPISLLDPVFGQLEDDMQNLQPSWSDFAFARELNSEMSQFFKEDLCITKLQRIFKEFGLQTHRKIVGKSITVSDSDRDHYSLQLVLMGAGNKTHASFFDVLFSYVQNLIHTNDTVPELRNSPLPAVLLFCDGIVGYSELLEYFSPPESIVNFWVLSYLSLEWGSDGFCLQLARALGSIKNAVNDLKMRYPKTGLLNHEIKTNEYPYVTSYQLNGAKCPFVYDDDQPLESRRVFIAQCDGRKICVKFVRRYSQEAHRFWEERGRAPELIVVNMLPAGWLMVIMEYLQGFEHWSSPPKSLWLELVTLMNEFQQHGFVHGDIRKANILIGRAEGSGELVFKLVDFDWAGKVGMAHYPSRLHPAIMRAKGVLPCGVIQFAHDDYMVERLFYHA